MEKREEGADLNSEMLREQRHSTLTVEGFYAEEMVRPLRIEFEDVIFHLCERGNARQAIFRDEGDCARFLKLLSESTQRFEAPILCFVLMGIIFIWWRRRPRPNLRRSMQQES